MLHRYRTTVLSLLLLITGFSVFAANPAPAPAAAPTTRRWDARITAQGTRYKGLLYSVTDSSLTLLEKGARYHEIPFKEIDRIRLRKRKVWEGPALVGWIAGGTAGALVGGLTAKKKDTGDRFEDDYNHVWNVYLRVFAGLFIGAIIGGGIGWLISTLFGGKKFTVQHDRSSYQVLKAKLERYTMR